MKKNNDLGIFEGVGMNIIDPHTHYTCSEESRKAIKGLLQHEYGIEPSDDVVEAFIQNEEDWNIIHQCEPDRELMVFHGGIRFIGEDRCEDANDRLSKILDSACMRQERIHSLGTNHGLG